MVLTIYRGSFFYHCTVSQTEYPNCSCQTLFQHLGNRDRQTTIWNLIYITTVLDHLAPIRKNSGRIGKHDDQWLSSDAKNKKIRRLKLERCYRKTGSLSDKKLYRTACREAAAAIHESRCSHYRAKLNSAYGDQKETWNIAKKLLHSNSSKTNNTIPEAKCDIVSQYFIRKLEIIKNTIQERLAKTPISKFISELSPPVDILTTFGTVTPKDVRCEIVVVFKSWILQSCSEIFSPIIAHLADLSFKSGIFPTSYKVAQITPIPKKSGLAEFDLTNLCPISNLNTISKILEKLALSRLHPHVTSSVNFNPLQSGFRSYHSTETALLNICNDILLNIDDGLTTILLSLDISSAFDTIDHSLLITCIKNNFGVTDIALKWLTSYLHSLKSFVSIGSSNSRLIASSTGVPKGSVLSPFLFSMFVSPIYRIIAKFGTNHHQYADDTQLYTFLSPGKDSINKITVCANAVTTWFLENGLLLNPNKTEANLFGSRKQTSKYKNDLNIAFSGTTITTINSVKILRVILDSKLSWTST
ncbi:uncharacterized protein LOC124806480 [Hydra vulgaris]|uniref:uncharacterized protein LOC124806480 n=1 Tax=Hydra vulgaris TaxID=6087 RepID=UPI001F5E7826|nr:uncharacterized protein LOC124806480 [Hydra vulgaris]